LLKAVTLHCARRALAPGTGAGWGVAAVSLDRTLADGMNGGCGASAWSAWQSALSWPGPGHALEAEAVVESVEGLVREAARVTMAGELAKLSRVWNQIRMGQ
jgi:hypothetical protein